MWDFVCLLKLKSSINDDAIIVPGQCGDFLGGSLMSEIENQNDVINFDQSKERVINYLKRSSIEPLNIQFFNKYQRKLDICLSNDSESIDSTTIFEHWIWRERCSKLIINLCRIYEYFNWEWYCPLWDLELMECFRRLPIQFRRKKLLYDGYVDKLSKKYKLPNSNPIQKYSFIKKRMGRYVLKIKETYNIWRLFNLKGIINFYKHAIKMKRFRHISINRINSMFFKELLHED